MKALYHGRGVEAMGCLKAQVARNGHIDGVNTEENHQPTEDNAYDVLFLIVHVPPKILASRF